jgi:hypothetical protein
MKKIKYAFILALITILLASGVYAQGATRITFIHSEETTWGSSTETKDYAIKWSMTITTSVSFPVDLNAYNNGTIDPASTDEIRYKISCPLNQAEINITAQGCFNITTKGVIPISWYKDFKNTTTIPATTPLGEWQANASIPVPIVLEVITIVITIIPIIHIEAFVEANTAVHGPASISKTKMSWMEDGAVDMLVVSSLPDAQYGDEITVVAKDFTYYWNATLAVELQLQGIHLITSPTYKLEAGSIPAEGSVEVSFSIQVVPEFTGAFLIAAFMTASLVIVALRKRRMVVQIYN